MRSALRSACCVAGASAVLATSAVLGTASAGAASPLVAVCGGSVTGSPGQPVAVSGSSVLGVLPAAARALPGIGSALAGPISVGTVGTSDSVISGATVADAVVGRVSGVPLVGGLLGPIRNAVTQSCSVTVDTLATVAAPVTSAAGQAGAAVGNLIAPQAQPGQPAAAGPAAAGVDPAVAPLVPGAAFTGIPAQLAGFGFDISQLLGLYSGLGFGSTPFADYAALFSLSGFDPNQLAPNLAYGLSPAMPADRVATASQVQAMPAQTAPGRIATPVLLVALTAAAAAALLARKLALRWSRSPR